MLISPTEPAVFRALGTVDPLPEEHGCDFLWLAHGKWVACQRKTHADYVANKWDGRLSDLYHKSMELGRVVLLLEGFFWEDFSIGEQLGVQEVGFWIVQTVNIEQSVVALRHMEVWFNKAEHGSLFVPPRSKEPVGVQQWRTLGAGPKTARMLCEEIGSPFVLRDDLTVEALVKLDGIGRKTAEKLLKAGRDGR